MRYLFFFALLFTFTISTAQEIEENNTDILLKIAQQAYREGNFAKALAYTQKGIQLAPEYHDIRILKIRAYLGLNQLQNAQKELAFLLRKAPSYPGVKSLTYQVLNHQKDKEQRLMIVKKYQDYYPEDIHLKTLLALFLLEANNQSEAQKLARRLLKNNAISGEDRYLLQNIVKRTIIHEIGVTYQFISFSDNYKRTHPWNTISIEYLRNIKQTSIIGRITYADRQYNQGNLYEIEAYPVFNKKFYAMLNAGFSNGELFPDFRGSASAFYNFAKKFEAEIGTRYLVSSDTGYMTGIVGLSLYQGRFYLNTKTYLGPDRAEQLIQNYQLNIRYYLKNADNYLALRLSSGVSPDEKTIFTQVQENPSIEAYSATLGIHKSFGIHHIVQFDFGYLNESLAQVKAQQYIGSIAYRYRF